MNTPEAPPKRWINKDPSIVRIDVDAVEKKFNAKYVGDFCVKLKSGAWSNYAVAVFWQEVPPQPGYSNYFGVFTRNGTVYITDASSTVGIPIEAVQAVNGEIIYSRYRWDSRTSIDGTASIDGGRDYTKSHTLGTGQQRVILTIEGPDLVIVDNPDVLFVQQKLTD